ncbi:MAG: hypothetical protein AAFR36_05310 [Bacteroidota bacterium]
MPLCYRLAFLLLVTCVWSCEVESLDDPIIVPVVDQEFSFQLWQNLSTTEGSSLEIRMYTLEDYDCLNTTILSNYARVGNRLELTLFDILDPETCEAGLAPAMGIEAISDIEANNYDLRIELQDVVSNLGTLMATNGAYTVAMQDENGIRWQQYEMRRIPATALWGYVAYSDATTRQQAEDFLADLGTIGSPNTLEDGYYGHYTLKENSTGLDLNTPNVPNQSLKFILDYNGATDEIDQRLAELISVSGGAVKLQLWDGSGNEWQN